MKHSFEQFAITLHLLKWTVIVQVFLPILPVALGEFIILTIKLALNLTLPVLYLLFILIFCYCSK